MKHRTPSSLGGGLDRPNSCNDADSLAAAANAIHDYAIRRPESARAARRTGRPDRVQRRQSHRPFTALEGSEVAAVTRSAPHTWYSASHRCRHCRPATAFRWSERRLSDCKSVAKATKARILIRHQVRERPLTCIRGRGPFSLCLALSGWIRLGTAISGHSREPSGNEINFRCQVGARGAASLVAEAIATTKAVLAAQPRCAGGEIVLRADSATSLPMPTSLYARPWPGRSPRRALEADRVRQEAERATRNARRLAPHHRLALGDHAD